MLIVCLPIGMVLGIVCDGNQNKEKQNLPTSTRLLKSRRHR